MSFDMSISQVARLTGTTSRALRHYDSIGLLHPSSVGANGYRRYDQSALVRLQRILMLRELGLPLDDIASVLNRERNDREALKDHVRWLESERARITTQIRAVTSTIQRLEKGEAMSADMFDGFDHTTHREEVEQRWGRKAYAEGDAWWTSLGPERQRAFLHEQQAIAEAYGAAARAGSAADSAEVQEITERHYRWLAGIPGTPGYESGGPTSEYFVGLGNMYVEDPRFGDNYDRHGEGAARLVRDAMTVFADRRLSD